MVKIINEMPGSVASGTLCSMERVSVSLNTIVAICFVRCILLDLALNIS